VTSFVFVRLLFWILPGIFDTWNAQTIDQIFRFRASVASLRIPYDSAIVHVDESDKSVIKLTGAYLSRHHYAQVVRALGEMKTAAQIYDYIFRAPSDPAEDQAFFAANRSANNAYYGIAFTLESSQPSEKPPRPKSHWAYLDSTKWRVNVEGDIGNMYFAANPIITFPELASSAKGAGYLSLQYDRDGVFRRAPLLVRYDDAFYPSFPFRAVCEYLNVTPDRISVRPGKTITLKNAFQPGQLPHDIIIPVDDRCNLIINYIGEWGAMTHYEFADVYNAGNDREELENAWTPLFRGKIVVASQVGTGAADVAPVPTDNNFPLSGVHANVLNTILTENFLQEFSPVQMFIVESFLVVLIYFLALQLSSRKLWVGALIVIVGYMFGGAALFLYANIIVNIIRPTLILVFSVVAVMAYRYIVEEQQKEALRASFESYLPPSIVNRMLANPESIFAGKKEELTILFSDIKSFTTYSSTMSPDEIQSMLNEYFEEMVNIVFKYEGTVDKYIGDGLMVFFGAPEPQPDHALRCVRAAIDMQKKCRELKVQWEAKGWFPLKVRVGVNTGPVVVGNMGSARKLSYTVLGADVNLANRLESNAPIEGIMISKRTYELVQGKVPTRPHAPVLVKGLDTPIEVYEVLVDEALTAS